VSPDILGLQCSGDLLFAEYSPEPRDTISAIFGTIDVRRLSMPIRALVPQ
jgi:hypothetical protein